MTIYQQNIIDYNFDENVIRNMLIASVMEDISRKTTCYQDLKSWLISLGYTQFFKTI